MAEILKTEKLTRDFGSLRAVNNVDFVVNKGEIRSVIGPNGAGKSTFLDLIINRLRPTSGKVFFEGRRYNKRTSLQDCRDGHRKMLSD